MGGSAALVAGVYNSFVYTVLPTSLLRRRFHLSLHSVDDIARFAARQLMRSDRAAALVDGSAVTLPSGSSQPTLAGCGLTTPPPKKIYPLRKDADDFIDALKDHEYATGVWTLEDREQLVSLYGLRSYAAHHAMVCLQFNRLAYVKNEELSEGSSGPKVGYRTRKTVQRAYNNWPEFKSAREGNRNLSKQQQPQQPPQQSQLSVFGVTPLHTTSSGGRATVSITSATGGDKGVTSTSSSNNNANNDADDHTSSSSSSSSSSKVTGVKRVANPVSALLSQGRAKTAKVVGGTVKETRNVWTVAERQALMVFIDAGGRKYVDISGRLLKGSLKTIADDWNSHAGNRELSAHKAKQLRGAHVKAQSRLQDSATRSRLGEKRPVPRLVDQGTFFAAEQ
jgi:hypothetical protein